MSQFRLTQAISHRVAAIGKPLLFLAITVSFCTEDLSAIDTIGTKVLGKRTLFFEENAGQVRDQHGKPRPDVAFSGASDGFSFHLRRDGVSYQLRKQTRSKESVGSTLQGIAEAPSSQAASSRLNRIDLTWLNSNPSTEMFASTAVEWTSNYYNVPGLAVPALNVKNYESITYRNLYSGIDLVYYGEDNKLKYDFRVRPKVDYRCIQLQIKGALISVDKSGNLLLKTPLGTIIEERPVAFQGVKRIDAKWRIFGDVVSYEMGQYDENLELIIDPPVRLWGTYLGGDKKEEVRCVKTDAAGAVYVCGVTNSLNFASTGAFDITYNGLEDAFVAKFDKDGNRLWSTYYGGAANDDAKHLELDKNNNVYVVGYTESSTGISTLDTYNLGGDAFIVKLNAIGQRIWGTYFGGSQLEIPYACAIDNAGNVVVTGQTESTGIATKNVHKITNSGGTDGFIAKFDKDGNRLWTTYIGGTKFDACTSCAVDQSNNIIISGNTQSTSGIATAGTHNTVFKGGDDVFITKFTSAGLQIWGTYFGGLDRDFNPKCIVDGANNTIITGSTFSDVGISTNGTSYFGTSDVFLAKFDPLGKLTWGTYFGGIDDDFAGDLGLALNGSIIVGGMTHSVAGIAVKNAYNEYYKGDGDGFVAKFDNAGSYLWGSYYGGILKDSITAVNVKGSNVIFVGTTKSFADIASNGFDSTLGGDTDGFLTKFNDLDELRCNFMTTDIDYSKLPFVINDSLETTSNYAVHTQNNCSFAQPGPDRVYKIVIPGMNISLTRGLEVSLKNLSNNDSMRVFIYEDSCTGDFLKISNAPKLSTPFSQFVYPYEQGAYFFGKQEDKVYYIVVEGKSAVKYSLRIDENISALTFCNAISMNCETTKLDTIKGLGGKEVYQFTPAPVSKCTDLSKPNVFAFETSAEKLFSIVPTTSGTHFIYLTNLTADLDLFVNEFCGTNEILSWSTNASTANELIAIDLVKGNEYYIFVDGYDGAQSPFSLRILGPCSSLSLNLQRSNVACFGGSDGQVKANVVGGVSPYTYIWSNGKTVSSISGLSPGTYSVTIKDDNANTLVSSTTISQPAALVLSVSSQTNIDCLNNFGSASIAVSGGITSYSYLWPNGQTSASVTNLVAGNHVVTVSDARNCKATITVTILLNPKPIASTGANNSKTICAGSMAMVTGATAANGTISWTHDGGGTLSNPTSLSPTYSSVEADGGRTIVLTLKVSQMGCPDAVASYSLFIKAKPAALAGGTETICEGGSAIVMGAMASNGSINWTHNGKGAIANPNQLMPTYNSSILDAGKTVQLSLIVTQASCVDATATYTVFVKAKPTAIAGGSVAICEGETAIVNGASATNGAILWTNDGSGMLTNPNTLVPSYIAGASDVGKTVKLTMTVSNAPCSPAVASFNVIVKARPVAIAGGFQTICEGSSATVSGAIATNGTIGWSHDGSGALMSGNTISPTYSPGPTDAGKVINLTLTVSNTPCTSATAKYSVAVTAKPTANIMGAQTVCEGEVATVTGASASNGSLLWSHDGSGTLSAANTLSPSYLAAPADGGKIVRLTLTTTNTSCSDAKAVFLVTVKPRPNISAGSNLPIFVGDTVRLLGTSNLPGSSYKWAGPGNFSSTLPNPFILNATIGMSGVYSVIVSSNGCSASATVNIVVNSKTKILVNSDPNDTICAGEAFLLTANPSGLKYLWSTGDTSRSISPVPTANTKYRVTVTNSVLGTTLVDSVLIVVLQNQSLNFLATSGAATQSICINSSMVSVQLLLGGSAIGVDTSGRLPTGVSSSLVGKVFTIGGLAQVSGVFTLNISTRGTCATAKQTISLIVNSNVSSGTIFGNTDLCKGTSDNYGATGDKGGFWSSSNPAVATVDSSSGKVTAISEGTSTISYTLKTGCNAPKSSFRMMTVKPDANSGLITGKAQFCVGDTAGYTTNGEVLGMWSSTNTSIATVDALSGKVTAKSTGVCSIVYAVTKGCNAPKSTSKTITVSKKATTGTITGDSAICVNERITWTTDGDAGGSWSSSNVSVASVNASNGEINAKLPGSTVIEYKVTTGCDGPVVTSKVLIVKSNVSAGNIKGLGSLCIGGAQVYTSDGQPGGKWRSSQPSIATVNELTGEVTPQAAGIFSLMYELNSGCGAPTSSTIDIVVKPNAVAGKIDGKIGLCIDENYTYSANGDKGGVWTCSDTAIATVNATTGSVRSKTPGVCILVYTVISGCNAPASAVFALKVYEKPDFSIKSDLINQICDTITTVNLSVECNNCERYEWTGGTLGSSINVDSNGIYQVKVTDKNKCSNSKSILISNFSVPMFFNQRVEAATCDKKNGKILLEIVSGSTPFRFNWSSTMKDTSAIDQLAPGWYSVTVTDAKKCLRSLDFYIDSTNYLPVDSIIKLSGNNSNLYVYPKDSICYEWIVKSAGGSLMKCLNGNNYLQYCEIAKADSLVALKVVDCKNVGCTRMITAVREIQSEPPIADVTIFPNPTFDQLTVRIISNQMGRYVCSLYDVLGTKVLESVFDKVIHNYDHIMPVDKLALGSYVLIVSDSAGHQIPFKVIKLE